MSNEKSITLDINEFKESNIQIIGPPGYGKTVLAQVLGSQCLSSSFKFIVFDPKNDQWLQKVLTDKSDSKIQIIDLNLQMPQISVFEGMSKNAITDMLIGAFGIQTKGQESDVYSLSEQDALSNAVHSIEKLNFSTLTDYFWNTEKIEAKKTKFQIKNIFLAQVFNGNDGFQNIVENPNNQIIYIRFDEASETQKLIAKLLFMCLKHIIKNNTSLPHITIFCDEFTHLLNKGTVTALELLRSFSCNLIIAYQSKGIFKENYTDINGESAGERIMNSCSKSIVYRDPIGYGAEFWSKSSGNIVYNNYSNEFDQNESSKAILQPEGRKEQKTRPLFEENIFRMLPKFYAVYFGFGIPKIGRTKPIDVDPKTAIPEAIESFVKPEHNLDDYSSTEKWEV